MNEIPTLRTSRLILREVRANDFDAFATMTADADFMRFLGDGKPRSRDATWTAMEAILGQWALRGYGLFAVEVNGQFSGRVGIYHPADWTEPELAWGLSPSFWGSGLATEAAAAARDWAFRRYGWPHLASYIRPDNIRSRRVAEKLGATLTERMPLRGGIVDRWLHPAGRSET